MSRRALLPIVAIVVATLGLLALPAVAARPGDGGGGGKGGGKPTTTTTSSTSSTTTTSTSSTTTTTTTTPPSDPNVRVVVEGESTVVEPGNFARATACQVVACPPLPHQDVVVHNDGDRAASGVVVAITPQTMVRNGEVLVFVEPATGGCTDAPWPSRTYTCDLGTIPAQSAVTVRLTYRLYGTMLWPSPAGTAIQEPAVAEVDTTATVGDSVASASMVIVQGIGLWTSSIL